MPGKDAASVAYLEGTRGSEDEARRRRGPLECRRIYENGHLEPAAFEGVRGELGQCPAHQRAGYDVTRIVNARVYA
jgi:hypothetical protein